MKNQTNCRELKTIDESLLFEEALQRVHLHTITTTAVQSVDKYWSFTGAIELASVQGSVIGGDVHAHISIFDWDSKQVYIGHLEPGSVVAYRAPFYGQLSGALAGVFRRRVLDDEALEELESALLGADVGVDATAHLLEELRSRYRRAGPEADPRELLRDALFEQGLDVASDAVLDRIAAAHVERHGDR